MAQLFFDVLAWLRSCLSCLPGSVPTVKVNERNLKILSLLGEGGFSYVYLVTDTSTSELFALKKIRCPFGAESVAQAMREVEAYRLFSHSPGIIHSIDYAIATERGGDGGGGNIGGGDAGSNKTVYVLLPYYRRGNLQDMINANLVNHARFPEKRLMELFKGVCLALKDMHKYRPGGSGGDRMEEPGAMDANLEVRKGKGKDHGKKPEEAGVDGESETEQQRPLMAGHEGSVAGQMRETKSYAHRDIKPGNIMISDAGISPILMDLGSVAPSPLPITSRSLAIATQDTAAEHSTMPYRAPELFDVKTGSVIDTKVDIWSLGCTLYACLVGRSPFEARSDETGGSLSICVLSGDWRFPDEGPAGVKRRDSGKGVAVAQGPGAVSEQVISEPVKEVVRRCLRVESADRPDIDELIEMVDGVVKELPDD